MLLLQFSFLSVSHRTIQYSPEEMLGMVLNYSRGLAEEFAGWKDLTVSYGICVCLYVVGFE